MGPSVVVPVKIFGYLAAPREKGAGNAGQALLLKRAVPAFKVCVVIGGSYPAVPVRHATFHDPLREPLRELAPMIGLEGCELERGRNLRRLNEAEAHMCVHAK